MSGKIESLGPADLEIAGLRIWVHGRQFPDSKGYWDGNWLRVTAYCASGSAHVKVHGAIIHLGEIAGLKGGCEVLSQTLAGSAVLDCMEPGLRVELVARTLGHVAVKIQMTPDHMTESHCFKSEMDQTYLPSIVKACRMLLERFPIVDQPKVAPG